MFFCSVSLANNSENPQKMHDAPDCACKNQCAEKCKNSESENPSCKENDSKENNKCPCLYPEIDEDDEYFVYNQCFFDKKYRNLKKILCLTKDQEIAIDNIYRDYKVDFERIYLNYINQKNSIQRALECGCGCKRENIQELKQAKSFAKSKYNDLRDDIKHELCKNQKKCFSEFERKERRKFKKLRKYCVLYKLPCINCCQN